MTLNMKTLDRTCLSIVIIVSILCGYLSMSHMAQKREKVTRDMALFSERLRDVDLADKSLQQLKTALSSLRKELEALNEQIPQTGQMGEFIKKIDSLMKQREAVMINLQPLPSIKEKLCIRNPFRMVFKGSFVGVHQLLRDLETMNRLVMIDRMTIERVGVKRECRVDLTASIFER